MDCLFHPSRFTSITNGLEAKGVEISKANEIAECCTADNTGDPNVARLYSRVSDRDLFDLMFFFEEEFGARRYMAIEIAIFIVTLHRTAE